MALTPLIDPFGRRIEYLRLSVTDRCDLRCSYCLPKGFKGFTEPKHWLNFAEIERIVAAFAGFGVQRVRLTGGEPLTRRGIVELASRLAAIPGISDLSLSTNGTQLEALAQSLARAGVRRVNVSLDSLDPMIFRQLTGGELERVLRGIEAAQAAGLEPIRINTVVMVGINDTEVEPLLDYCAARGLTLRLIEPMPMGQTGQAALRASGTLEGVRRRLEQRFNLIPDLLPGGGPARYYRLASTQTRIGFITPLSQHFCATCNRVRLSAEGRLYLCLGHEHSYPLGEIIRTGISDEMLKEHLLQAIASKPERHQFNTQPQQIVRFMALTGG